MLCHLLCFDVAAFSAIHTATHRTPSLTTMATSKGKGKQIAPAPPILPPLPNPPTGSANPAASLSSLWAYLTPALDHIVKSSTNNPSKAPSIDVEFYAGIHSACYN